MGGGGGGGDVEYLMSHVTSLQLFSRMFRIHVLCNKPKPINSTFFLSAGVSFSLNKIEYFFF